MLQLQHFLGHHRSSQSVQSLNLVQLSVTPWTAARQASLSIANSQSLLRLMSPGASETNLQIGPRLCISQLWRVPLLVTKHATNGKTSVPTLLELPAIRWCWPAVKPWFSRSPRSGLESPLPSRAEKFRGPACVSCCRADCARAAHSHR